MAEASSWRAVFLVNVPLGIGVLALAHLLPESRAPRRPGLDLVGTCLLSIGTALVVYPILQSRDWILLPIGAVVLGITVLQQARSKSRLVELSLFAKPRLRCRAHHVDAVLRR